MSKRIIAQSLLIALFGLYFTPKDLFAKEKNNKKIVIQKKLPKESLLNSRSILEPVVRLTIMTNNPKKKSTDIYHATAFSVSYSKKDNISFLITNAHFCIFWQKDEKNSILFAETSETFRGKLPPSIYFPGQVLKTEKESDLCAVMVRGKVIPVVMAAKNYMPKQLEPVVTVGAPGGVFPIITKTNISAVVERKKIKLGEMSPTGSPVGMISAKVYPGQSGSPVYNQSGKVIGIIFSATNTYGGFFVLNKDIYKFIE